ncbi:hypothetical protein DM860_008080 [Cuscuta australis]|uniref:RING-type E3 ubiquitin transferase n=1 Tax=Cuscuta australis TaxID=267555 RepID=A0A328D4B6_9ASTE|nr:hypothetical protein DM860_008080 [Cuscuta australis]
MEDAGGLRCWCYGCSRVVSPIREIEPLNCPFCEGGFVEEMETAVGSESSGSEIPFDSEHAALSLWAPILLGMMRSSLCQRNRYTTTSTSSTRLRHVELDDDYEEEEEEEEGMGNNASEHTELYRELDSIIRRRRRRSSATILQLIQGIQAGMADESFARHDDDDDDDGDDENERERRGRVILINPFNQSIIVHGSNNNSSGNPTPLVGSLGDYFFGPGLDVLLQQLAENDPNQYGTPPAQKKAVEAMPVVRVEDSLQCCVCLDDIEIGSEAKEMPCKHKFHCGCILPWLELHSSCPVCRHQLPCDEDSNEPRASDFDNVSNGGGHNNNRVGSSGRQFSVPIPWPFGNLLSPSTTTNSAGSRSHTQED